MNTLETHSTIGPHGKTEECAKFVIDTPDSVFILSGIATVGDRYTFSLWVKAEGTGAVTFGGSSFSAATEWVKHSATFTAESENVTLSFTKSGTYYIYHPQLELGNKATDWTPAPEDVDEATNNALEDADTALATSKDNTDRIESAEATIQQLADSISSLVRKNGQRQEADGLWYFDISEIEKNVSDTANGLSDLSGLVYTANGEIDVLKSTAAALQERTEYVRSYTDANDQPCLELGEGDSVFKVRITNTEIQFAEGTAVPTRINRNMLIIEKAMVKNELQFGDEEDEGISGVWIWKRRANGNLGLMWKDVVS